MKNWQRITELFNELVFKCDSVAFLAAHMENDRVNSFVMANLLEKMAHLCNPACPHVAKTYEYLVRVSFTNEDKTLRVHDIRRYIAALPDKDNARIEIMNWFSDEMPKNCFFCSYPEFRYFDRSNADCRECKKHHK